MAIFVDIQNISFLEKNVDDLIDLSMMSLTLPILHFFSIEMRYSYCLSDVPNKKSSRIHYSKIDINLIGSPKLRRPKKD